MSEHFHYIEDMSLAGLNLGEKMVWGKGTDHPEANLAGETADVGSIPTINLKPREIEIGIVNRKPLYIVFRLDKLKLWGVSDE